MARRFVESTWNNAAAPKKRKPKPPLRYRINPLDKQVDDLEALQAELDREYAAGRVEGGDYVDWCRHLDARKDRLHKRLDRMHGIPTTTPKPRQEATRLRPGKVCYSPGMSALQAKLCGVAAVLILLKIFA